MDQREVHMRWNMSQIGNCGGFDPSEEFHLSISEKVSGRIR